MSAVYFRDRSKKTIVSDYRLLNLIDALTLLFKILFFTELHNDEINSFCKVVESMSILYMNKKLVEIISALL